MIPNTISKTLDEYMFFIKALIITFMALVAFFIDKNNSLFHWTWVVYFSLTCALLTIEYYDNQTKLITPIEKIKEYLADYNGWKSSGGDNYEDYYDAAPELTIRTNQDDNHLDFDQEWTRGEIGSHYTTGNSSYYREIYFHNTLLHQVHIVVFDGGKKTIVAPDWQSIGKGRIYFYLKDSIEFIYQNFVSNKYKTDHSKGIKRSQDSRSFDIPIFKNQQELGNFISFCGNHLDQMPDTNKDKQNEIFYNLLDKYNEFREQKNG
jgi:hypothetical protein